MSTELILSDSDALALQNILTSRGIKFTTTPVKHLKNRFIISFKFRDLPELFYLGQLLGRYDNSVY